MLVAGIRIEFVCVGSKSCLWEIRRLVSMVKSAGSVPGEYPVISLNTWLKLRTVAKLHFCDIAVIEVRLFLRMKRIAFSIFMMFRYWEKVIPDSFLNILEKWAWL